MIIVQVKIVMKSFKNRNFKHPTWTHEGPAFSLGEGGGEGRGLRFILKFPLCSQEVLNVFPKLFPIEHTLSHILYLKFYPFKLNRLHN